jgi:hypothetical protein
MTALSTSALVLHDLGLATGFGGPLFGRLAMHPAVAAVSDKVERGVVTNRAWQRFQFIQAASIGAAALTWLAGRAAISGHVIDRKSRWMVLAKDGLLGAMAACNLGAMIGGRALGQRVEEYGHPIETGNEPAWETPSSTARVQRFVNACGNLSLVAAAGVIGLTAVLNMKAGKSHKWAALARVLP